MNMPYSAEKFVNREKQKEEIEDLFRGLSRQTSRGKHLLFQAERGFGKTWLALHAHRTLVKNGEFHDTTSLFITLMPLPANEILEDAEYDIAMDTARNQSFDSTCKDALIWVCGQLDISYPQNAEMIELKRALTTGIAQKFIPPQGLVFVVDSVYEADWKLIEAFEQNLIAPLAEIPNVRFIMTGRGRPYPWVSPVMRTQLAVSPLSPLQENHFEQLKYIYAADPRVDGKIFRLSGGNPLVSVKLLQNDPITALDQSIGYFIESAHGDPLLLRKYFEALCVLEKFRETEMEKMLQAYYSAKNIYAVPPPAREVRDELLKTGLLRWENGGYVMDATLKTIAQNYLKLCHPEIWSQLLCTAYGIYTGYAQKYVQYKQEYEQLAHPFKEMLESIGQWEACQHSHAMTSND